MPVYHIQPVKDQHQADRLVKASNIAQALRHVAKNSFTVELAEPEECVDLGAAGVKVEQAGEE